MDVIRTEYQNRKSCGRRIVYILKCSSTNCLHEIKVRKSNYKADKFFFCKSCSHKKRPFESIYNGLMKDHRKLTNTLTYEEFLEFTEIKNCYFCNATIPWSIYGTQNGEFTSRAYFLDRFNNDLGYSKDNCVVCCTRCNKFKGSLHGHEFIAMCALVTNNKTKLIYELCNKITELFIEQADICDISREDSCGS